MNFSELVSIDPNQIKARANTNVYLVIGLLIRWMIILSSGKIKKPMMSDLGSPRCITIVESSRMAHIEGKSIKKWLS